MKKSLMILLGIVLTITLVAAAFYPEPFVTNLDINEYNISNANWIWADYFNGTFVGIVDTDVNWTKLQNYPAACPGSGAITQLNDSVTCSDLWLDTAGDMLTGNLDAGQNNITNITEVSSTLVDTTNLEADNLESNLDGTGYNITTAWFKGYLNWSNLQNIDFSDFDNQTSVDWANITNKFITAVDGIYLYMSGTTATLNETKLNLSIRAIDTATNTSMKTYVDNTFITQANEGNLNVNHSDTSNSTTWWATIYGYASKWFYSSSDDLTLNETQLNISIEAYGYSTEVGTVTSVATDDSYLTGGAITTTGTITFNSTLAGTSLAVNSSDYWDNLGSPSDIGTDDITDDGTWRLDSWDNLTGIPHATPSNGDTTHFSLADEIYDWVIGLAYATDSKVDSLGNWSDDKGDYWNASLDLDTVIATDEIAELKIDFDTACAAGNHYYLNGNNLACEADDYNADFDTEDEVEAAIFDADNTANLGMGSYNVTAVECIVFESGGSVCSGV